jgi:phosphotransferase system  glucose/maltose/N-acetylglucosamine-specific IIC component
MRYVLLTARILGSAIVLFVGFFLVAHLFGGEDQANGFADNAEIVMFIMFPVLTLVGLIIAYKWPGIGGGIATLSMAVLFFMRPDLPDSFMFIIIPLPGLLYLIYGIFARRN